MSFRNGDTEHSSKPIWCPDGQMVMASALHVSFTEQIGGAEHEEARSAVGLAYPIRLEAGPLDRGGSPTARQLDGNLTPQYFAFLYRKITFIVFRVQSSKIAPLCK